jgi:RNA polymerase sigma factor (sigma-70 family)
MDEHGWLAERFEENRGHLQGVAFRMLGSMSEADDAVQEAWLRLSRSDTSRVENLGGWLTTVVARVSLDMLRSRKSRREEPLAVHEPDLMASRAEGVDPERQALLADSVGPALLVILERLAPAERLAFVLHDMFAVPFDEIAPIVGRSPAAARQLASRARRRVRGAATLGDANLTRQRAIVTAFLAASRNGDFAGLLALLDPDVVLRADAATVRAGAVGEVRGALAVTETFSGRARAARPALIDGTPGAVWMQAGRPQVIFGFTITGDTIIEITMISDPIQLDQVDVILDGGSILSAAKPDSP